MTANRAPGASPFFFAASGAQELERFFRSAFGRHRGEPIVFLCIGTDRSTGDCLGPLVGTMLEERGVGGVIGTLREPCDADRLGREASGLPADAVVIAIDACLGRPENVGKFLLAEGPLQPARSVGAAFPPVGDYSIAAVVGEFGPKPYMTLQTTSLYAVMEMAKRIADAGAAALAAVRSEAFDARDEADETAFELKDDSSLK
ncbi:putative sporulation protein YyaC [Cohnella sp. OV330]|uniref:spore protease YyaC n=1 Tax=Cohnella sp. OV330 TaxID=1855288 RepID=UPI0008DF0C36|nr:spore protease YyaC [Cohnella sp. OV330]SFA70684.1 putative sporulation protein YyaC [Cohnella sp. OV330]